MQYLSFLFVFVLVSSCSEGENRASFTSVEIETIYEDTLSIRAIEIMGNNLAFAANKGT